VLAIRTYLENHDESRNLSASRVWQASFKGFSPISLSRSSLDGRFACLSRAYASTTTIASKDFAPRLTLSCCCFGDTRHTDRYGSANTTKRERGNKSKNDRQATLPSALIRFRPDGSVVGRAVRRTL
jgi:hypothetical protein